MRVRVLVRGRVWVAGVTRVVFGGGPVGRVLR